MVEGEGATFFGRTFLSPASEIPTYSSLSKLPLLFFFTQITALEPSNRLTFGSINGLPVSEQVIGRSTATLVTLEETITIRSHYKFILIIILKMWMIS
jgi:hypothetical protein